MQAETAEQEKDRQADDANVTITLKILRVTACKNSSYGVQCNEKSLNVIPRSLTKNVHDQFNVCAAHACWTTFTEASVSTFLTLKQILRVWCDETNDATT